MPATTAIGFVERWNSAADETEPAGMELRYRAARPRLGVAGDGPQDRLVAVEEVLPEQACHVAIVGAVDAVEGPRRVVARAERDRGSHGRAGPLLAEMPHQQSRSRRYADGVERREGQRGADVTKLLAEVARRAECVEARCRERDVPVAAPVEDHHGPPEPHPHLAREAAE
jgi:hypothetical protein